MKKRRITKNYFYFYSQKYYNLMRKIVSRSGAVYHDDIDDCMAIAMRELLFSMIHFDTEKGATLTTYLYRRISGILKNNIRNIDQAIVTDPLGMDSIKPRPCMIVDKVDNIILVKELMAYLKPLEREVLLSIFFGKKTLRELGKEMNVSRMTICNIKNGAMRRLREKFPELCFEESL